MTIRVRIEHDNDHFDVSFEDTKQPQVANILKVLGVSIDRYGIDETLLQIRETFKTPQLQKLLNRGAGS